MLATLHVQLGRTSIGTVSKYLRSQSFESSRSKDPDEKKTKEQPSVSKKRSEKYSPGSSGGLRGEASS